MKSTKKIKQHEAVRIENMKKISYVKNKLEIEISKIKQKINDDRYLLEEQIRKKDILIQINDILKCVNNDIDIDILINRIPNTAIDKKFVIESLSDIDKIDLKTFEIFQKELKDCVSEQQIVDSHKKLYDIFKLLNINVSSSCLPINKMKSIIIDEINKMPTLH